jgi:hypothetical protein
MAPTYLHLTNRVLRALNEVELDATSFGSALGFHAEAKSAINAAIRKVLEAEEYEWPFLYRDGTQVLVVGQGPYNLPSDCFKPDWDSFYIPGTATVGATHLGFLNFDEYRRQNRLRDSDRAVTETYAKPRYVTLHQSGTKFAVTPTPDLAYTVKFEYFARPDNLVAAADETVIPAAFEDAIFHYAMYHAYMFRDNVEQAGSAQGQFDESLKMMRRTLINRSTTMRAV